jgi:hypothetical protein
VYENEVIVASGDDEEVNVGVGITSDNVVHLLAGDIGWQPVDERDEEGLISDDEI